MNKDQEIFLIKKHNFRLRGVSTYFYIATFDHPSELIKFKNNILVRKLMINNTQTSVLCDYLSANNSITRYEGESIGYPPY